jgi:hypothetical protein
MSKTLAIFIDAENTNTTALKKAFEFIQQAADCTPVCIKAFGDFSKQHLRPYQPLLLQYGIDAIQCFNTGKNTADHHLYIHALETLYTTDISCFAIIASDKDYLPLLARLTQQGKQVLIFASHNCNTEVKNMPGYICIHKSAQPPTPEPTGNSPRYKDLITALREAHYELQDEHGNAALAEVGNFLSAHYPNYAKTKGSKTLSKVIQNTGCFSLRFNRENQAVMYL